MEADLGQETNVFARYPEVVEQLEAEHAPYRAAIPDTNPIGWTNLRQ